MSQAVEGTHSTAVSKARRHHRHPTLARTDQRAHEFAASSRDGRSLAGTASLMAVALIMTAAPVYVLLAVKGIADAPPLWNLALDLCRVITALFGLLAIVSTVPGRSAGSSCQDILGSIIAGVVFIAAAVVGLGLVLVVTGLAGLALLYASAVAAADAFRSQHREPARQPASVATPAPTQSFSTNSANERGSYGAARRSSRSRLAQISIKLPGRGADDERVR